MNSYNLPVEHYLEIYQGRKKLHDEGIINIPEERYKEVCELIKQLKKHDLKTPCKLIKSDNYFEFIINEKVTAKFKCNDIEEKLDL